MSAFLTKTLLLYPVHLYNRTSFMNYVTVFSKQVWNKCELELDFNCQLFKYQIIEFMGTKINFISDTVFLTPSVDRITIWHVVHKV